MAKLTVLEFLTLDGVMEAPEKWQFPYMTPEIMKVNQDQIHSLDVLLLGRITYEIFATSWAQRTNNEYGLADKLNSMPKYVVSTTLTAAEWANTEIINFDIEDTIRKLKQKLDGNIGIIGSATLVASLAKSKIIDEYQLQIYPTIQSVGKRLFNDGFPNIGLELRETVTFTSGAILLTYHTHSATE